MQYPIPASPEAFVDLRQQPVSEEVVASAIVGVVFLARSQGRSLEELKAEVLHEDTLLDRAQRRWLSEIVTQAWQSLP